MWDWGRDLLPEHLWIAAVIDRFGKEQAYKFYYAFMDAFDEVWPNDGSVALGLLSDFAAIPPSGREELWSRHEDILVTYFHNPLGRVLTFYPAGPAAWLVRPDIIEQGGHVDPEVELRYLRHLVQELLPRRGEYASTAQALAFGRLLKHDKVQFGNGISHLLPLLEKYPVGCTDDEKVRVESLTRSTVSAFYLHEQRYKTRDWPKYFWRHNLDLAVCRPISMEMAVTKPLTIENGKYLRRTLQTNAVRARGHLERLQLQVRYDLYSPERDEILFGLFARLARFYVLLTEDPNLWARDMAGIILRCLADTAITFGYLAKCGTDVDFESFRKYAEGQEKLLLLHLQDSYPGGKTADGRGFTEMADDLGWFAPELLDIELGHWSKKDTRKLAQAAGMEKLYRLLYTPTSADVHGSWVSLKNSNLCLCAEPLHRFHRLPTYLEPPLLVETMVTAQQLFLECIEIGVTHLHYPPIADAFEPVIPEGASAGSDGPTSAEVPRA